MEIDKEKVKEFVSHVIAFIVIPGLALAGVVGVAYLIVGGN